MPTISNADIPFFYQKEYVYGVKKQASSNPVLPFTLPDNTYCALISNPILKKSEIVYGPGTYYPTHSASEPFIASLSGGKRLTKTFQNAYHGVKPTLVAKVVNLGLHIHDIQAFNCKTSNKEDITIDVKFTFQLDKGKSESDKTENAKKFFNEAADDPESLLKDSVQSAIRHIISHKNNNFFIDSFINQNANSQGISDILADEIKAYIVKSPENPFSKYGVKLNQLSVEGIEVGRSIQSAIQREHDLVNAKKDATNAEAKSKARQQIAEFDNQAKLKEQALRHSTQIDAQNKTAEQAKNQAKIDAETKQASTKTDADIQKTRAKQKADIDAQTAEAEEELAKKKAIFTQSKAQREHDQAKLGITNKRDLEITGLDSEEAIRAKKRELELEAKRHDLEMKKLDSQIATIEAGIESLKLKNHSEHVGGADNVFKLEQAKIKMEGKRLGHKTSLEKIALQTQALASAKSVIVPADAKMKLHIGA
ncbi:MAG: hypothetical protein RLZZ210_1556 [Pseudomonadota bacterium]|jgi:hypothetical protein